MEKGKFKNLVEKVKVHHIYVVLALAWGLVMVFVVPPFQVPDEIVHYYKASGIAEGELICPNGELNIQEDRKNLPIVLNAASHAFNYDSKVDTSLSENYEDTGTDDQVSVDPLLCKASFIGHIAPGAGIVLGQITGMNELQSFYAGRVTSLLVAIALTALALKFIPFAKKSLLLLALLPMTVFLYASMNYDAIVLPSIFLFVSFCLYLLERKKPLSILEVIVLLVLVLVISSVKMSYQPLLLILLLFLPRDYWKHRWHFLLFLGAAFVASAVPLYLFTAGQQVTVHPAGVVPDEQLGIMLGDPLGFVSGAFATAVNSGLFYAKSLIGVLGWLDYDLSAWSYVFVVLLGGLVVFMEYGSVKLGRLQRVVLFISSVLSIVIIFVSMYLYSTPVGYWGVLGIQGRYFIPVALPLALSVMGVGWGSVVRRYWRVLAAAAVVMFAMVVVDTILATIARYYVG